MKKNILFCLCLFLFIFSALAGDVISPYRTLDKDYTLYLGKAEKILGRSALGSAKYYNEENLPKATKWASLEQLQKRFYSIRDERMLSWKGKERRLSWLYPDDGCYARAAMVMRNIFRSYAPMAKKVFVFGNLRVKTRNSSRGVVGWWYHVAPIVEVDGVKYVIDPSIEYAQPLPLKDWLSRMGKPEKMRVSICSSGTYVPGSNCESDSDGIETRAENAEQFFLAKEMSRMQQMNREAEL
jgi:hypothetical protein